MNQAPPPARPTSFTRDTRSRGAKRGLSLFYAALAGLLAAPLAASAARLVEDFAPGTAGAWTPYLKSPAVVATADGLAFPAPFSQDVDRAAWDKAVNFDLSAAVAFELDVACPAPDAVRALGLYFKSGAGWYVANKPLAGPALHTLVFNKSDFTTEGKPAGWNRIDGIRLSPWKGANPVDTALVFRRLATVEGSALVVVRGTTSCPDAGARAVAEKTAARVSGLLIEAGLGHVLVTDDDLPKGALKDARLALLPYNPNPAPAQLKALTDFVARGGKLGVFYGSSPALAAALGFRLGPYIKSDRPGRWRSIVFADPMGGLVPPRIWQDSSNLMPAFPAGPGAQVVAYWHDARDARQPEPALVASPRGFWMSHILLSDDQPSKKELLVALCARLDPALWTPAALRAMQDAGRINDYAGIASALAGIARQLPFAARPGDVRALLDQAAVLSAQIQTALAGGQAQKALLLARRQRQLLLRADAAVQPPRPGEFVGVWDHDGTGYVPGDWAFTANLLAAHGVTAVFANVVWGGCAHYPSKFLPASATLRLYGDQIAAGLAAAHAKGLEYHVWMVLGKLDGAPPEFVERMKKEGRLQVSDAGVVRPWLSPHHNANRALLLAVVEEIARNYPGIDGLHLDYIRLPDSLSCYSASTRARFESDTRKKCARWPADVLAGGKRNAEFRKWRTADITRLVADIRATLRRANPKIKLSAAVFGIAAPDGGNIAQYWPDWLKAGTVDFLTPMNYTESSAEFARLVRTQVAYPGAAGRIYPGIGVTADESRLDPAQVARQIALLRQAGCPGFLLFDLSGTLRDETLPALRQGITRPLP
ncbi:MAG TPA: family 10 glycosylhydrolase [Kiritimatiellia bacterium]|nr:family 10 glycosylhydrolase [Kiritimatiellia bacterium]